MHQVHRTPGGPLFVAGLRPEMGGGRGGADVFCLGGKFMDHMFDPSRVTQFVIVPFWVEWILH